MEDVGRSWYLKITRGLINGTCEVGTHHVSTGTQVWLTTNWNPPLDPMTEQDVLDELYMALMRHLERLASHG